MEPAKIDWKRVESIFIEDKVYENINAPKWVDFLAPEDSVDDESWFCRPDCKHPKTAEDFFKTTTPTSKLSISADGSQTPPGSWNQRDAKLKRRAQTQYSPKIEESENQNPNLSTPSHYHAKFMKAMIKSSTERKKPADDDVLQANEAPRLKSTLSARNLFVGRDILGHISEFCNEFKKMATRARGREDDEKLKENRTAETKDEVVIVENPKEVLIEVDVKEKDRTPLLEMGGTKSEGVEGHIVKEKQRRKKKIDDVENIPVPLNLANIKSQEEERLLQIRTNPPSPQCFSAARAQNKSTPSKDSKSRFMERGILQAVKQNKEVTKEETKDKGNSFSLVEGKEARALDVFWFLKPCTLSN